MKEFKKPAMNFIEPGAPALVVVDDIEKVPEGTPVIYTGTPKPDGFRNNPAYIESRTRRVQSLFPPSLYEAMRDHAKEKGVSLNEIMIAAAREYLQKHTSVN